MKLPLWLTLTFAITSTTSTTSSLANNQIVTDFCDPPRIVVDIWNDPL